MTKMIESTELSEQARIYTAQKIAERIAAMLYIMSGEDMVVLGFVDFDRRPRLTKKGCELVRMALSLLPEGESADRGEGQAR